MKARALVAAMAVMLGWATGARATVDIETVPVGHPRNTGELSGEGAGGQGPDRICGAVDYEYRIGKYEVTAGQYCEFLNAVAATDPYGLYVLMMSWLRQHGCNIQRSGESGGYSYSVAPDWANRPVNWVDWGDAARFANWLHNGQPTGTLTGDPAQDADLTEDGAYFINGAAAIAEFQAVTREADWKWAIPTEDEWYKAAYYDGEAGVYYDYATGTDSRPSNDLVEPTDPGNNATFTRLVASGEDFTIGSPYYRTDVGAHENSESPYGTYDQSGNVSEWTETVTGSDHAARGGGWFSGNVFNPGYGLHAAERSSGPPYGLSDLVGFRVCQVPEPATLCLLALGGLAGLRRRRS
ncbi:MAG: SUMF1/EgtB/PvdO family nonheme iron enzyme [Phycisphaerae bacterium]